ncbi:hypothetical protein ACET3Z_022944 [Daucus carota]
MGPYVSFLDLPVEKLKEVEVVDALKHPKLNTVKKITVDSATLFDKNCLLSLILLCKKMLAAFYKARHIIVFETQNSK